MTATTRSRRIRLLIIFFIFALAVSGITALPLQGELSILDHLLGPGSSIEPTWPSLAEWIGRVDSGVQNGYGQYPFLAYGTDWLAFAHLMIAVLFIGPLRDPVRNRWVVEFGMIACVAIIPWVLILAPLRDIPIFWMLIDTSFGVFGIIPLWLIRRDIVELAKEERTAAASRESAEHPIAQRNV